MAGWLSGINDYLEQVPSKITNFFSTVFRKGEEYSQDFVDAACRWLAWSINITVERARQKALKGLYNQYNGSLKVVTSLNVIKKAVSDPLGTIGAVFNYFSKPFSIAKSFYNVMMVEIPRLAENLANIANALPPAPPNPQVNFNAFKLKVNTVSLSEIMAIESMPTPEEMFPAPPSPFSKEVFDSSFENAKPKTKEEKIKYRELKKEEKAAKKAQEEAEKAAKKVEREAKKSKMKNKTEEE